jgi:uncharacterized membrane protein YgcG
MRKSTLFISVVLTTFMLAVMYGVVSAYQNIVKSTVAVQSQTAGVTETVSQPVAVVAPTQVAISAPVINLTPEAAAALAGKVLGRTDMYSVELTQFEGVDAYLVTFSSGDLVYLSLNGQVLSISKLPVTVISQPVGGGGGGGGNGGGGGSGGSNTSSGGEHEEHEDEGGDHD